MRIDPNLSAYHERTDTRDAFDDTELRHCRLILRRLRFLETKVRESDANGGLANPDANGGAMFAEREVEALAWILVEMEFLQPPRRVAV